MPRSSTSRTTRATCTSGRWRSSKGPPLHYESVRAMVESKLPLVPRYRQKVRFVPLGLGRPVWVDDPHFNLIYHLRQTALPTPGGNEELRNLVGRVMSQQLDRSKPLWEMWVVEGLDAGRWALLSKVHHCMVDGVSGTDLLAVMLDQARDPAPPPASEDLAPASGADLRPDPGRGPGGTRRQPLRDAAQRARRDARAAGACVADLRDSARPHRHARSAPVRANVIERTDRAASPLGLGSFPTRRRKGGARGARRHRQRRRACR